MEMKPALEKLIETAPKVHCLTNPVTMQDVANVLLAAGGSAIMAQDPAEASEITAFCQATLLNTGVPDDEKFRACILTGKKANELGHPVVLDPVGVGASRFRREHMEKMLKNIQVTAIRCNQEEAAVLLHMQNYISGGVESAVALEEKEQIALAVQLARAYDCVTLVSGVTDVVSDGKRWEMLSGGDMRIRRITGSGCMLSALCALFCGTGIEPYDGILAAGIIWKRCSKEAGDRTDREGGGIGTFHRYLFDALDIIRHEELNIP